jgi:murein DD-endopeptidase MepM/ murein hydrolase activator NlpD
MTIYIMQFSPKITKNSNRNKHPIFKGMLIVSLAISPLFLRPETANAGLISFISSFGADEAVAQTKEVTPVLNSSNMVLLQAAVNSDPNPHKVDEYSPLAYGNALVAQIGPQGTPSEIHEDVPTEISLYTVHEGDTLSEIAEMFDVSVNTIIWANQLGKNPTLKKGQQLIILPITGIRYTVKKGDTIKGIVNKHKANLEEVLEYNNLSLNSVLVVGSVIMIPDAEFVETPSISPKSSTAKSTLPFYPGYFIRPITGGSKSQGIHGHNAVDLAASVGTVIRASAGGKVIASLSNGEWNGGYGNYVIISHANGTQTLYAHNQKNFVGVGDTVEQGQMIAKVGMTGKTTGPHVHFEIRGAKNPF